MAPRGGRAGFRRRGRGFTRRPDGCARSSRRSALRAHVGRRSSRRVWPRSFWRKIAADPRPRGGPRTSRRKRLVTFVPVHPDFSPAGLPNLYLNQPRLRRAGSWPFASASTARTFCNRRLGAGATVRRVPRRVQHAVAEVDLYVWTRCAPTASGGLRWLEASPGTGSMAELLEARAGIDPPARASTKPKCFDIPAQSTTARRHASACSAPRTSSGARSPTDLPVRGRPSSSAATAWRIKTAIAAWASLAESRRSGPNCRNSSRWPHRRSATATSASRPTASASRITSTRRPCATPGSPS